MEFLSLSSVLIAKISSHKTQKSQIRKNKLPQKFRATRHLNLIKEMSRNHRCVKFLNLSMSSFAVFSDECSTFLDMMNDIGIDKKLQHYIIKKNDKQQITSFLVEIGIEIAQT